MSFVRVPVAIVGLALLAGCVGTDGQAKLNAAAGPAVAVAPVAVEAQPTETMTSTGNVAGVMPGDLLITPGHERAETNPYAVLERPTRTARAPSPQRSFAERFPQPTPLTGSAGASGSAQTATFAMAPLAGARRIPSTSAADGSQVPALRSRTVPIADVEAQAAIEQRAQDERNRRFDAHVKRASSLVCSGCVTGPGRRPARPARVEDASED